WIRRRLIAGFGHYHEFILDDLVNAGPAIIPRGPDHLHELLHSFSGAAAGERETADLLKVLARGFFHSRKGNLAHKKPSASTNSTFCGRVRLLDDYVRKTGIRADRRRIEQ